jgi:hypothetical protein
VDNGILTGNDLRFWLENLGDFTFLGWFTTALYAAVFVVAWTALVRQRAGDPRLVRLWRGITVLVGLMGINKQLDFQTLALAVLFEASRAVGPQGRWVLFLTTLGVVVAVLAAVIVWAVRRLKHLWWRCAPEAVGLGLMLGFLVFRTPLLRRAGRLPLVGWLLDHPHALEVAALGVLLVAGLRWCLPMLPGLRGRWPGSGAR